MMEFLARVRSHRSLAWLVSRYSARLSLQLFFSLSSPFLAALAVIFAGKGAAALQAAGEFIGIRLETDHVVASAIDKPRLAAGLT
jgi:high-affinity Fe2+/Pb2+ permease